MDESYSIENNAQESSQEGDVNTELNRKLRQYFDGKIVRKDLTKHIKEGANVPVYYGSILSGMMDVFSKRWLVNEVLHRNET